MSEVASTGVQTREEDLSALIVFVVVDFVVLVFTYPSRKALILPPSIINRINIVAHYLHTFKKRANHCGMLSLILQAIR